MMKMKAVVIRGPKDLKIEELDIPKADDDSIVLKVHKAAICNATEYHIWEGNYTQQNTWLEFPHILGHECSGEIVEIGKNVKDYQIGDRIAFGSKMGGMDGGAFAEYNLIYPNKVSITKLAENLSYEEGSLLEPLYGVLGGACSSEVKPGDKVLIMGTGPIGLLHLQVARLSMAMNLIAVDLYENRLKKAQELGADLIINASKEDVVSKVKDWSGELDVIIDATGTTELLIDKGIEMLRTNGKYFIYGHAMGQTNFTPMKLSGKGIHIAGIDPSYYRKMIPLANKLVSQGLVNVKTLITHRMSLEEVEKGIMLCRNNPNEVLKVLIDLET